jgi:hypothetical protein
MVPHNEDFYKMAINGANWLWFDEPHNAREDKEEGV